MRTSDLLTDARALTLRPPWSHAVAHHGKTVENRTWMPPVGIDTLLIHAGLRWSGEGRVALDALGLDYSQAATSAIVAVADLAFACDSSGHREVVCYCGPWALPRHCHWNLINVRTLPEPVPATGRQGLWRPPSAVLAQVADALDAMRQATA